MNQKPTICPILSFPNTAMKLEACRDPRIGCNQGASVRASRFSASRRGFTLVEVLVVITMIVVLAAIVVTATKSLRRSASATKTLANLRQLTSFAMTFSSERNGEILSMNSSSVQGYAANDRAPWMQHLLYTAHPELLEPKWDFRSSKGDRLAESLGIFSDPLALGREKSNLQDAGYGSWNTYAYNFMVGPAIPGDSVGATVVKGAHRASNVEYPDKLVLFSLQKREGRQFTWWIREGGYAGGVVDFETYGGKTPLGYFDGHVEMHSKGDYPIKRGPTRTGFHEVNKYWYGYDDGARRGN